MKEPLKPGNEICDTCNGAGVACFSCCTGDVIKDDYQMCPSCMEHLGEEECSTCEGEGQVLIGTDYPDTGPDMQMRAENLYDAQRRGE